MKNNLFKKLIVCLLTLVLVSLSAYSIAKDLTSPPYELLQGKPDKEKLLIIGRWQDDTDNLTKESITAYFECKRDLANLNKRLDSAKEEKKLIELQKDKARYDLKQLLLKVAFRITGGAVVISTDVAADLYLAGRAVKQAIKESITSKDGEQVNVQKKDAAEAQRLVSEASKRQQFVASLEKALVEAEQKVKAAEANRARVASRTPPKEQTASPPATPQSPTKTEYQPLNPSEIAVDDLLYGRYDRPGVPGNAIDDLKFKLGRGKPILDLTGEFARRKGESVPAWSKRVLNTWAKNNKKVIFDLTGIDDLDDVLRNQGLNKGKVTSQELRHIKDNWVGKGTGLFNDNNVIFIRQENGKVLKQPRPW